MIQLGLIGYPLGHSLSPHIHQAALKACRLEGEYSLFPIPPDDNNRLQALLRQVRGGEILGLNVTIPHKENVIPHLDQLTPTAQAIGAVNTIVSKDGALTGDNTDAPGFLHDLERLIGEEDQGDGHALILGAGGSAKAVAYALYNAGWKVTVAARRIEQAQALARRYAFSTAAFELPEAGPFSLIINTTPLGMTPNEHTSPWPIERPLPRNAAVYDLVYNPSETKLVREARAAGLRAATGAGMLIEQAALSFETWTGCSPPRAAIMDAMRQR